MPDYQITFINHSTVAWTRTYWSVPENISFTVNTSPNDKLQGGNGTESLAWSQLGTTIGAGDTGDKADGQVIWESPNGTYFGVKIHIPLQLFGIGSSPYYQVKTNGDWSGEHRGDPYNFDKSYMGFDVVAKGVTGHQTLEVVVTINDI